MSLKPIIKILKNEEGVTLVELLAAITILTIIVTAFLAFFIQGGKANQMTDEKNVATFIAVEEMEQITSLSNKNTSFPEIKKNYKDADYETTEGEGKNFKAEKVSNSFNVTLIISEPEGNSEDSEQFKSLYRVNVTVTEGGQSRAEMQSVLPFKE